MSFGNFIKDLKQAKKALKRLDSILTTVELNPNEPASIWRKSRGPKLKLNGPSGMRKKNDSINARYGSGVKLAHMRELVDQISYDLPELDALRMA